MGGQISWPNECAAFRQCVSKHRFICWHNTVTDRAPVAEPSTPNLDFVAVIVVMQTSSRFSSFVVLRSCVAAKHGVCYGNPVLLSVRREQAQLLRNSYKRNIKMFFHFTYQIIRRKCNDVTLTGAPSIRGYEKSFVGVVRRFLGPPTPIHGYILGRLFDRVDLIKPVSISVRELVRPSVHKTFPRFQ